MSVPASLPDERKKQVLTLREIIADKGNNDAGWETAWQRKITPWDAGRIQPALREFLDSNQITLPKGRVIVPGCGTGYDAIHFATLGHDTWGVDISETAVEKAKLHLAEIQNAPTNVEFKLLDFFAFDIPEGGFDLAYDYTFFVALPPDLRPKLAARYSELVNPGSLLITLIWPIGDRPGGPPYSVSLELYKSLFSPTFELVHTLKPTTEDVEKDKEQLICVWKRK